MGEGDEGKKGGGDKDSRPEARRTPRGSEKVGHARGHCFESCEDAGARSEKEGGDGSRNCLEERDARAEEQTKRGIGGNTEAAERATGIGKRHQAQSRRRGRGSNAGETGSSTGRRVSVGHI